MEENAQVQDQLNEKINELNQQIKEKDIEISAYKNAISNISFTFNNDKKINSDEIEFDMLKALNTDLDDDVKMG